MKSPTRPFRLILLLALFLTPAAVRDQHHDTERPWTEDERQVLGAIERLSASTAPGGGGADAYARVLSNDYSRWTLGSDLTTGKETWVEGIRDWFEDGWRVSERETDFLDIRIEEDYAFTRRIVRETFAGPAGERSESKAAIAEVWKRSGDGWRLLQVDVIPLENG